MSSPQHSADADDVPLGRLVFNDEFDAAGITTTLRHARSIETRERKRFWRSAGEIVLQRLTEAAQELLGSTATDLLASGWRLHGQLIAAARYTVANPGRSATVELADEDIEVSDRVDVDVTVDSARVMTVAVSVVVTLHVGRMRAVIRAGRLQSIVRTNTSLDIDLCVDDVVLLSSPTIALRADRTRTFDPGLDLLGPA